MSWIPRPRPSAGLTDCFFLFSSPTNHMQTETEKIQKGFDEMRDILDREERIELQKLGEDEMHVLGNLAVAEDQVVQQRQNMRELISYLQYHMCESSIDTLQVGLGQEHLYMQFGGITEIKLPSLLDICAFFLIKRYIFGEKRYI